jgi:PAS domain S-box-containing protein
MDAQPIYQRLLNGLGDKHCVFSHTPRGIVEYVSPGFKVLFGISPDEIIGKDWRILNLTAESLIACETADQQILADQQPQSIEISSIHPDGSVRIIEANYNPVIENGVIVMLDGICTDITESKRAEKEIAIVNQELQTINRIIATSTSILDTNELLDKILIEALQIVELEGGTVCLIDPDNTLRIVAEKNTSEETIADLTQNKIKVGDCLCGNCALDKCPLILRNRSEVLDYSTREAQRNEDIHFHAAFPFIVKEKCVGVLCVFTFTDKKPTARSLKLLETLTAQVALVIENAVLFDSAQKEIEERKQIEHALLDALEQAKEATAAKSRFLANMSHEIRTPMNGVLGVAQLLASTSLDDEQSELVEMLNQSGNHMMSVINDILDIAKIEAGKFELSHEPFNISQFMDHALMPIQLLAQNKGLTFCYHTSNAIPSALIGDPARIGQILTNLASNAVKFTQTGSITIDCMLVHKANTRATVCFTITDTGIGIPTDKLDQVFEPFFQVDGSNTRKFGGTGLGLSISRQIAEMMNGKLNLSSSAGNGTTVTLTLPLEAKVDPSTESNTENNLSIDNTAAHILIVEDDAISATLANTLIKLIGVSADTATTGEEALLLLKSRKYALVLMDCALPIMDGYTATRAIRSGVAGEANKTIPIIAQTAHAMTGDENKCLESGMNDYISKPLNHAKLTELLNKWLPIQFSNN